MADTRDSSSTLPQGTTLGEGERYEVRGFIGKGGMGHVYRVRDRKFDKSPNPRYLALKILAAPSDADPSILQRFLHEAQATSGIEHDHIVPVLDYGVDTTLKQPFFVMPLLRGTDFGIYLRDKAPLEVAHAVDIMVCIAAGVAKCHSLGIIHRDLKPSNIFLAEMSSGLVPKLIDFGIAKYSNVELTTAGAFLGTAKYFSPEQAAGKPADAQSDQYALALLLYAALTGTVPFRELTGVPLLEAIKQGSIPRVRTVRQKAVERLPPERQEKLDEIPEALDAAIHRALSVHPSRRFPSVHEFARELVKFSTPNGLARAMWSNHFTRPPEHFVDSQFSMPVGVPAGSAAKPAEASPRGPAPEPVSPSPSRAPTRVAGDTDATRIEPARPSFALSGTTTRKDLFAETPPVPLVAPAPSAPMSPAAPSAAPSSPSIVPAPVVVSNSSSRTGIRAPRLVVAAIAAAVIGATLSIVALSSRRHTSTASPELHTAAPDATSPTPPQQTAAPAAVTAPRDPARAAAPSPVPVQPAPVRSSPERVVDPAAPAPVAGERPADAPASQATKTRRRSKRQKSVEYLDDGSPLLQ